jgi:hypothetical protein
VKVVTIGLRAKILVFDLQVKFIPKVVGDWEQIRNTTSGIVIREVLI